ncbi:hypothetical protein HanIR_Chr01g0029271 [Helianthus annuus]|nr:hypothetical protein HanIR_Chr01g0029271 [Helianthus annuus]
MKIIIFKQPPHTLISGPLPPPHTAVHRHPTVHHPTTAPNSGFDEDLRGQQSQNHRPKNLICYLRRWWSVISAQKLRFDEGLTSLSHLSLTEKRERERRWGGVGGEDVGGRWWEVAGKTVMWVGCSGVGAGGFVLV